MLGKRRQRIQKDKGKKNRLFNGKHDQNKLPVFDPHRPVTLPCLVRALANIPQEKETNRRARKRKKKEGVANELVSKGYKHFKGSFLSDDFMDDKHHDGRIFTGRQPSPPSTRRYSSHGPQPPSSVFH